MVTIRLNEKEANVMISILEAEQKQLVHLHNETGMFELQKRAELKHLDTTLRDTIRETTIAVNAILINTKSKSTTDMFNLQLETQRAEMYRDSISDFVANIKSGAIQPHESHIVPSNRLMEAFANPKDMTYTL